MTSCYSQSKTTYLQVIPQVSGKYFLETARFSRITECHLYELYKIPSGFSFLVSKFSNLSNIIVLTIVLIEISMLFSISSVNHVANGVEFKVMVIILMI